ncbi:MAG: MFS transporter [Actinomycetota bacterium]|nr:MFS transporter [Actinomycetota bacterium]
MSATEDGFSFRALAIPAYGPTLLFGLGEGAILPVLPLSARSLGASVAIAATMVVLINVGSLVFNVPSSVITDRYGERPAIIGAAVVGVLASGLFLIGSDIWVFMVGALLYGISASVFMLARQTYLTEAVPASHRARALSTLGGVMRIGVFAGPFLGAAAMSVWHLAGAYAVSAAALLLAGVLGATLKDLPRDAVAQQAKVGDTGTPSVRGVLRDYRKVFLTVGMGVLLVSSIRASRQAVIPLWAEHLGLSPTTASLIYGVSGGIDMLVFYPAGKVMDIFGRRWVTVPSMLVMGLAMMAMPLTHGVLTLALVSCVLGFGNGIGSGMVMTLGADFSPVVGRPQFLGIWRELSDAGSTLGPALLAGVTAILSLGAGIVVCGGLGFAAATVMWRSVPSGSQHRAAADLTRQSETSSARSSP